MAKDTRRADTVTKLLPTRSSTLRPILPAMPSSGGSWFGTRTRLNYKDERYVRSHTAVILAKSTQTDVMRQLIDNRVALALSISKLAAIAEVCAAEYLKGRRQRAADLLLHDLSCQEAELHAKAAVAVARKHLNTIAPLDASSDRDADAPAALTPDEVDEILAELPEIPEEARHTVSLLLNARVSEKQKK
jgi:hypothetical protein